MATKQRKAGAAELVALVAIGTVLHDGETYVDGESLAVDAATAARRIEVGGAKPEGEAPADVAPADGVADGGGEPADGVADGGGEPPAGDTPEAPAAEA